MKNVGEVGAARRKFSSGLAMTFDCGEDQVIGRCSSNDGRGGCKP
jgi:hypothetical protein